ncbi:PilZ domain-containing protein [Planctobacterium marinum]
MSEILQQKLEQYHEYFTIKHELKVNLSLMPENFQLPELNELSHHMPYAFRMASELADIETKALRPLRHLGEHARELADFLNHQSRKIDLMMSYILHQQDNEEERFTTIEFGGAGLAIKSTTQMTAGEIYQVKIFIEEEASAVFCYAEVIQCESIDEKHYRVALLLNRIREQDQELLVRASLHLQTRHLKKRNEQAK